MALSAFCVEVNCQCWIWFCSRLKQTGISIEEKTMKNPLTQRTIHTEYICKLNLLKHCIHECDLFTDEKDVLLVWMKTMSDKEKYKE